MQGSSRIPGPCRQWPQETASGEAGLLAQKCIMHGGLQGAPTVYPHRGQGASLTQQLPLVCPPPGVGSSPALTRPWGSPCAHTAAPFREAPASTCLAALSATELRHPSTARTPHKGLSWCPNAHHWRNVLRPFQRHAWSNWTEVRHHLGGVQYTVHPSFTAPLSLLDSWNAVTQAYGVLVSSADLLSGCLGSSPSFATHQLCDLGHLISAPQVMVKIVVSTFQGDMSSAQTSVWPAVSAWR